MLADLASVESQLDRRRKAARTDRSQEDQVAVLEQAHESLAGGTPLYRCALSEGERVLLRPFFLLTNKPVLAVVNLGEEAAGDERVVDKACGGRAGRGCRGPRGER